MNPIVTIEMENGGVMKAELYPEIAPNTVIAVQKQAVATVLPKGTLKSL